jgi:hypothetical protein
LKTRAFGDITEDAWEYVCDNSSEAWLFHRHQWVKLESRFFVRESQSIGIEIAGVLVAVAPLFISGQDEGVGGETLLHSGVHRHTGLAILDGIKPSEVKAIRSAYMQYVFRVAEEHGVDRIQLNVHNLCSAYAGDRREEIPFWCRDYGFYLGLGFGPSGMAPGPSVSTCCADQIVDLKQDEETLFSNLDSACRRAVRKANAVGLGFSQGRDEDVIDQYYQLAVKSASRSGEAIPSIDYYRELYEALNAKGHASVFFADYENRHVAALFLLIDKEAVSFMAGISDPDTLELRVNDYIHWQAILWARAQHYCSYRLGPIFPELPADWPIVKVSKFKGKFGGVSQPIIQGSYFRNPEKYRASSIELLESRCSIASSDSEAKPGQHS